MNWKTSLQLRQNPSFRKSPPLANESETFTVYRIMCFLPSVAQDLRVIRQNDQNKRKMDGFLWSKVHMRTMAPTQNSQLRSNSVVGSLQKCVCPSHPVNPAFQFILFAEMMVISIGQDLWKMNSVAIRNNWWDKVFTAGLGVGGGREGERRRGGRETEPLTVSSSSNKRVNALGYNPDSFIIVWQAHQILGENWEICIYSFLFPVNQDLPMGS